MPWTEYFCHFDNFPNSSEDFEFGMLALVTVVGLVLVLLQQSKNDVAAILGLRRWLPSILNKVAAVLTERLCARGDLRRLIGTFLSPPGLDAGVRTYNIPIRI
ncbi:hypothetical protein [Acidicapsa ligni]|uniref:hypothetical protein n=1 Tax=Acidicapsa ligni TaxID=542300 RepID=UPI0021DF58B1|nr:hypothetical protein [Acidicapsa ligni]